MENSGTFLSENVVLVSFYWPWTVFLPFEKLFLYNSVFLYLILNYLSDSDTDVVSAEDKQNSVKLWLGSNDLDQDEHGIRRPWIGKSILSRGKVLRWTFLYVVF